jgi:hypothetical protein
MFGEYTTGGAWRRTSQSTKSLIFFGVLTVSISMFLMLELVVRDELPLMLKRKRLKTVTEP